jgi:hypothetical protein
MSTSLSDVLTAQKNGVVGINSIATSMNILASLASPTKMGQAAMTASYATIYTVPNTSTAILRDIEICNTTASPIGIYVSVVPVNGSAAASNAIFFNANLPGYSTMQWTGAITMSFGTTVQVKGSTTGCTVTASGGLIA